MSSAYVTANDENGEHMLHTAPTSPLPKAPALPPKQDRWCTSPLSRSPAPDRRILTSPVPSSPTNPMRRLVLSPSPLTQSLNEELKMKLEKRRASEDWFTLMPVHKGLFLVKIVWNENNLDSNAKMWNEFFSSWPNGTHLKWSDSGTNKETCQPPSEPFGLNLPKSKDWSLKIVKSKCYKLSLNTYWQNGKHLKFWPVPCTNVDCCTNAFGLI